MIVKIIKEVDKSGAVFFRGEDENGNLIPGSYTTSISYKTEADAIDECEKRCRASVSETIVKVIEI